MKRFLADALLVWLVISLMTYINEDDPQPDVNERITEFEDEIARHEAVTQKVDTSRLNPIHENHAARMAQAGSEFVVNVMDKGVDIVSQLIHGFMQ